MSVKLAIVDFDCTLYKRNSFPEWIIFCLWRSAKSLKLNLFVKIAALLILRKIFRRYDHIEFKRKINGLSYPEGWGREFCRSLVRNYNVAIINKLRDLCVKEIIISTAAPECYARYILPPNNIKLLYVSSSKLENGRFCNNYGVVKKDRTIALLDRLGMKSVTLLMFTDHLSDIYLAKHCHRVFLCNPRSVDYEAFIKAKLKFDLLSEQ